MRFGLTGAAGYVAPRHMKAMKDLGHDLVAALDPADNVGVLDRYAPGCEFFKQPEIFDRHLELLRREKRGIDYLSVCSPNWLHDAHARMAMRVGADAIVEKPLVISPWNLSQLEALEEEHGQRVWAIMQLRYHPNVLALRAAMGGTSNHHVELNYIAPRGKWYDVSWKGDVGLSGGLAMNLGVHLFDMLLWIFGPCHEIVMDDVTPRRMGGVLSLERATVYWTLSVNGDDLEPSRRGRAWRELTVGDQVVDFSSGFESLHTKAYEEILAGRGMGISEARPAIELLERIRHA